MPTNDFGALVKQILDAVDDAVMRVGASANCYDVPADANSGAEYVAARVRSVVAGTCTRRAQRGDLSPSLAAREAAEEISSTFGLKFQEDSLQRVAWIISKSCSPIPAAGGDEDGPRSECCDAPVTFAHDGPICGKCGKWTTTKTATVREEGK